MFPPPVAPRRGSSRRRNDSRRSRREPGAAGRVELGAERDGRPRGVAPGAGGGATAGSLRSGGTPAAGGDLLRRWRSALRCRDVVRGRSALRSAGGVARERHGRRGPLDAGRAQHHQPVGRNGSLPAVDWSGEIRRRCTTLRDWAVGAVAASDSGVSLLTQEHDSRPGDRADVVASHEAGTRFAAHSTTVRAASIACRQSLRWCESLNGLLQPPVCVLDVLGFHLPP